MRAKEFIIESVTFSVADFKTNDPKFPKGLYSTVAYQKQVTKPCWVCDATGKETSSEYTDPETKEYRPALSYKCRMCDGKGEYTEWESIAPELNVANSNLWPILDMTGTPDQDYSGSWTSEQLPEIRRRLIKLKNTSIDRFTEPSQTSRGERRISTDDNGLPMISRGPTMHYSGRTLEQVTRYIDELLNIIDYAQKHNAHVIWG